MTLDQLRYFLEVAREGHMGRAAKSLRLSASAVSHSLAALEAELDTPLFHRAGRRLVLTEEGRRLATEAADLLERADRLKWDIKPNLEHTTLRLGGPPSLMTMAVGPASAALARSRTKLDFHFAFLPSLETVRQIKDDKLDLAFGYDEGKLRGLSHRRLYSDRGYICARVDHPLFAAKDGQRLELLAKYPLISPQPRATMLEDANQLLRRVLRDTPRVNYLIPSYDLGASVMTATDAWGIFPEWVIRAFSRRIAKLYDGPALPELKITMLINSRIEKATFVDELAALVSRQFEQNLTVQ